MAPNEEETQPFKTLAITTIPTTTTRVNDQALYEERYQPWFVWMLLLAPVCIPFFWKYQVVVTSSQLQVGYSTRWTQLTVDRSHIVSAQEIEHVNPLWEWGGWGIRMKLFSSSLSLWHHHTGYIPKSGKAVQMTIRNPDMPEGKEKRYTFICDDPATVCKLLMS